MTDQRSHFFKSARRARRLTHETAAGRRARRETSRIELFVQITMSASAIARRAVRLDQLRARFAAHSRRTCAATPRRANFTCSIRDLAIVIRCRSLASRAEQSHTLESSRAYGAPQSRWRGRARFCTYPLDKSATARRFRAEQHHQAP